MPKRQDYDVRDLDIPLHEGDERYANQELYGQRHGFGRTSRQDHATRGNSNNGGEKGWGRDRDQKDFHDNEIEEAIDRFVNGRIDDDEYPRVLREGVNLKKSKRLKEAIKKRKKSFLEQHIRQWHELPRISNQYEFTRAIANASIGRDGRNYQVEFEGNVLSIRPEEMKVYRRLASEFPEKEMSSYGKSSQEIIVYGVLDRYKIHRFINIVREGVPLSSFEVAMVAKQVREEQQTRTIRTGQNARDKVLYSPNHPNLPLEDDDNGGQSFSSRRIAEINSRPLTPDEQSEKSDAWKQRNFGRNYGR